jgi:hypothetical protein
MQRRTLKFPVYAPEGALYAFEGLPSLYSRATWRYCVLPV